MHANKSQLMHWPDTLADDHFVFIKCKTSQLASLSRAPFRWMETRTGDERGV